MSMSVPWTPDRPRHGPDFFPLVLARRGEAVAALKWPRRMAKKMEAAPGPGLAKAA